MPFLPSFHVRTALILEANRLCADTLRRLALHVFPHARIELASSFGEAEALDHEPVDLLVIGSQALPDGDVLDFLSSRLPGGLPQRVLVIATECDNRTLVGLRALAIHGVFDSVNERSDDFLVALRSVADGIPYWSSTVLERLRRFQSSPTSLFRLLTPGEQRVLAMIGDGSDDVEASRRLGMTPATVTSVRRSLHRKLGVQHRGELVRIAAQNGFVRFTFNGVERPGFNMLSAACHPRPGRRAAPSNAPIPLPAPAPTLIAV